MKKLIIKIITIIKQLFCQHKNKKLEFLCHPDRYIVERCINCGKEIWSDI